MAEMTMVERVARALCAASADGYWREPPYNNLHTDALNNHWRHKARAAIAAMREPTAGMKRAGMVALNSSGVDNVYETDAPECFTAMIDKALKETV